MTSNQGVHKCCCNWDDQCRKLQSSLKASDVWFGKIKIKAKKGSILRNLIAERFKIKNPERDYYIARHHWDPVFIMYLNKYKKYATTPFLMKAALEHGFHSSCVPVSENKYICEPRNSISEVKSYISSRNNVSMTGRDDRLQKINTSRNCALDYND